jgi:hypothetical protein
MRIDQLTDKEQLISLENKWHKLVRIEFPTQFIQDEALDFDCDNIRFINNPSLETQLKAIRLNPTNFYYIKNTKYNTVKVLAVSLYERNILLIDKPSEDIIILAISKDEAILDILRHKGVFKYGKNGNKDLTELRTLSKISKYIY